MTADPQRDGRRTSRALTVARTVLGNVEHHLEQYKYWGQEGDPASDDIMRALVECQRQLEPFRRTGRPKKE